MKYSVNAILVAAALLAGGVASAKTYDAEEDLGLVAEDAAPEVAARNTRLLSAAFEAGWAGGKFTFKSGETGPVLHPITCAGKEFFFAGTIATAVKAGGAIHGAGGRVPLFASNHYRVDALGGVVTRFTRIDGGGTAAAGAGGAILRVRGSGFTVSGIEFRGRPFVFDPAGEGPEGEKSRPKGTTRTPVGIEIEGRTTPPTGWTAIEDCAITECGFGVCCRSGHYDAGGKFVDHENHADQGNLSRVVFTGCDSCFRSENQQAVGWTLRDITVNCWGGKGRRDVVLLDLRKVGGVSGDGIWINHPNSTLIRVGPFYSQNANRIELTNVKWDRMSWHKSHCRIFQYDGPVNPGFDLAHAKWQVRVSGHIGYEPALPDERRPDVSRLIDIPDGANRFPLAGILLDIERLMEIPGAREKFEPVGGGPWVRPTTSWIK